MLANFSGATYPVGYTFPAVYLVVSPFVTYNRALIGHYFIRLPGTSTGAQIREDVTILPITRSHA